MGNLIISEHVVNENMCKLANKDVLNKVFATSLDCLKVFKELKEVESEDAEAYDEFVFPDTGCLLQFAENRFAIIPIVNNVLGSALEAMENVDALLDQILDLDEVPEKMQKELRGYAEDGISYVSTFIFYEFLNTAGYDEVVYTYCGKHSVDVDGFIKEYASLYKENRRSLGVFNDHPELEQPFLEVVGPALPLIPEDALTLADVTGVITGELPLETLMEKLGITEDDDREDLGGASNIF